MQNQNRLIYTNEVITKIETLDSDWVFFIFFYRNGRLLLLLADGYEKSSRSI